MSDFVFLPKEWLRIKQILQVLGEAVFVVGVANEILFVNEAAERLTGFTAAELVGQHYSVLGSDSCQILEGVLAGGKVPDENPSFLFSCKDGETRRVSEKISPITDAGGRIEAVICVWELKSVLVDPLTGLYTRSQFERELKYFDQPKFLPLSILVSDVDGLKLTNDIFGHQAGDELLKLAAYTLQTVCGTQGHLFRWGGDEFIVLLPNTSAEELVRIITAIRAQLEDKSSGPIKLHMSLGCATKEHQAQDVQVLWELADEEMYWMKSVERGTHQREMLENIAQELFSRSNAEKEHARRVGALAKQFGDYLGLSEAKLWQLRIAGQLHDIGKVALDPDLLHKPFPLSLQEQHQMKRHSLVGFRLLNFFEDTVDVADGVLAHHERWDGRGYPKGLTGKEIPFLGRVLAIIETFDRVLFDPYISPFTIEQTLQLIQEGAGNKFDPDLVCSFVEMIKTQGLLFEKQKKLG